MKGIKVNQNKPMIQISKQEREALDRAGLLKYRRKGNNSQDQNFMIANKGGRSGAKSIYVTESFQILTFLERYDGLGLMKVWPNQAQKIIDAGLVKENQVQHSGEYIKGAVMFVSKSGEIRVKKSWEIMNCLGWNKNKSSKD